MAKQTKTKATKRHSGPRAVVKGEQPAEVAKRLAATPFQFMRRFGEEMDRLFEDFGFDRGWLTPTIGRGFGPGIWSPDVEMFERNGEFVVRADLPGLTKDDVKVEVTDDGITIEGDRQSEQEGTRDGFYSSERSYGKFYRRLPLPEGVKAEDANASFNNGVLEITLKATKRNESKARRVEIRDESRPHAKAKAA